MADNNEWVTVHDTAVTNTTPDSMVHVTINTEQICENMTNKEFRGIIQEILGRAIPLVEVRIGALSKWPDSERVRVAHWFGRSDETTRTTLVNGLTKVHSVLRSLTPANFVRTGSDGDKATG